MFLLQIYQPQFGMGNQLRALDAGLAVARVLGRVLVVPDYISDNGEGQLLTMMPLVAYGCVLSVPLRLDVLWVI